MQYSSQLEAPRVGGGVGGGDGGVVSPDDVTRVFLVIMLLGEGKKGELKKADKK